MKGFTRKEKSLQNELVQARERQNKQKRLPLGQINRRVLDEARSYLLLSSAAVQQRAWAGDFHADLHCITL
jgi:hypothetical protein